ncbi:MAG: hypothetical protein KDH89_13490, partial [Anaerolineae bacterium]|nr:hypothetical protein [Anaerolineae bacterium]
MRRQRRMSLILIIALLAAAALPAVSGAASPPLAPLTPTQVNVAGSFEEAIGGANWNNDDPLTDMGDANLDGVWKFNATFPGAGNYEYKIVENADWSLAYPADNVPFSVEANEEVGWYYDENDHYVSDTTRHVVATAVGDWPEAIGGVNWSPANLKTWMKDPDGDGVYAFSAALPAGDYQFKVAMNESWDVSYPADNVPFTVPAGGSDVTFLFDSATNDVSFEVGGGAPPLVVTFPGDWPEAAGLGNNWDPGNLAIQANDDNNDGVWKFVTDAVPAGSYQFKAAVGGTWDENYGVNGTPNGDNVPFTTDGGTVNFYYDRDSGDNFVASRPDYTIPVVAGDFLEAIGGANWSPDNLRSWMKDPDGDGVYTFIAQDVPEGDWQYKVALNESWDVSYPQDNVQFSVPAGGGNVTFSYDGVTHEVSQVVSANMPPDEELVQPAIQTPIQDNVMYFALTDRMWNADPSNDEGAAPGGTLEETGFLPTDKSFYHGGDLAGMIDQLDYLEGMGINSIWLTPVFENIPTGPDASTPYGFAGSYHGYWALDWENADPHLGTNAELQAYIDAAHARGIKVFFDIVANHSADIITYVQNEFTYRNKADYPYRDANGQAFDDRDYALADTFPPLDVDISFPYTPTIPAGDEDAKNPDWLNNPLYYHNRGDSTFVGESSQYGDFFGLDDLFTEQVDVVNGFINIFNFWVDNFDIDGYRLDTAKHVNIEFWQRVAPAVLEHAQSNGKPDFTMFGEVFDGNPEVESYYTTVGMLPSVLDFGLHGAISSVGINNGPTNNLANLFASDDYFTDADSNAYQLGTFISNHDLCRAAYYINQALPNAPDDELVARVEWGYAMLYFARGFPIVYYGDEQGFTGGGSDKLCREDMLPSQVPDYMDEDLLGTDATPADDNFDTTHPLYQALAEMAAVRADNLALRRGAQITRYSTDAPGVFAFSRIERDEQVEYVVVFNSATTEQHVTFPVYLASTEYNAVYPAGEPAIVTDADAGFTIHMMPGGVAVYKASTPLPASDAAPEVTFTTPAAGAGITGRAEIGVTLSSDQLTEVTFAVKVGDGDWEVIGTDTNPPYRVFYNTDGLDAGTPLVFRAIANDLNGHLNGASSSAVVGAEPTNEGPKYAVIHYYRDDGDYGDPTSSNYNDFWGLHLWGDGIDSAYLTDWTDPWPFFGEDDYGVFAWIELSDPTQPANFIVHRGDTKDPPNSPDRSFLPADNATIWLMQDDVEIYNQQGAAQNFALLHYRRPAGDYGD